MNELTNHTGELEDLIWQASQLSANVVTRNDLKIKLKNLDQRWKSCHKQIQERLMFLESIHVEMVKNENVFSGVFDRVRNIWESVNQESAMNDRTQERLQKALEIYEVF